MHNLFTFYFIDILSAIYSVFFYEKIAFKYHFKVKKLETVAKGTLDLGIFCC